LQDLNLKNVHDLATLKLAQLRLVFGPFAVLIFQRAQGIDASPVCPPRHTPEICEHSFLSEEDNDDAVLLAELCRLVESCAYKLRRLERGAAELKLTIYYADGVQQSRGVKLDPPQNHDLIIYAEVEKLFVQICTRRTRVKGFKLSCRKLGCPDGQRELFAMNRPSPQQQALQESIDRLRGRYGMPIIKRGHTLVA
jgi:DNA polymerase-4